MTKDRRDEWQEFRYIRKGKTIPDGWELVADFEDCHHGRYSQGIIKRAQEGNTRGTKGA